MPTPYWPQWQLDALGGHLGAVELVGDLDQDACAVAHQLVGADRAAMVEVLEDLQALRHDVVRAPALDVRDEAHAAGVVLAGGVVQASPGGGGDVDQGGMLGGGHAHGESFEGWGGLWKTRRLSQLVVRGKRKEKGSVCFTVRRPGKCRI